MKKRRAFTLIELTIVMAILLIVFASLFMILNVGNLSHSINSEKIRLYEQTREAMRWICRDIRQTTSAEITDHTYSDSLLSFRIYTGFDTDTPQWSDSLIEYAYDPQTRKLIRTDNNSGLVLTFGNIVNAPFVVSDIDDHVIVVRVLMRTEVRGKPVEASLASKVRIRNE